MLSTKSGKFRVFAVMALAAVACVATMSLAQEQAVRPSDPMEFGAAAISEDALREALKVFAGAEMKGRGTLNGGYKAPSEFLEKKLKNLGLVPKGDLVAARLSNEGSSEEYSYFQNFKLADLFSSRNVIGYLEGENKDELVIIGSHYDHVGLGETGIQEGRVGDVFFGADDNGSGTVANLAAAEAFTKLVKLGVKPKRSILFCFWGAEEWGEIGSEYFLNHPPKGVDPEKIVAYVNMDMVGRNDPGELFVLCSPANPAQRASALPLYELADGVNEKLKLKFSVSHADAVSGFSRTDGWQFYNKLRNDRKRIPVWELFSGLHDDYHTPRDTADKIDYKKLARVARFAFGIAWQVSETPEKPKYKE